MRKITKGRLTDVIIRTVAFSTMLTTALVAPNALKALDKPSRILINKLNERERKRIITETLSYMRYNGMIDDNFQHGVKLTAKAHKRLAKLKYDDIALPEKRRWDGVWRLVIFDVNERNKYQRDLLRLKLRELGFGTLQRSVYIYPHPCRNEIAKISGYLNITDRVMYVETQHIDNDESLRNHFRV